MKIRIREAVNYIVTENRANEIIDKFVFDASKQYEDGINFMIYDGENVDEFMKVVETEKPDYIVNINDISKYLQQHGLQVDNYTFDAEDFPQDKYKVWGEKEVTVLMPVYNVKMHIVEAVSSVLHQTYSNFEFLIVDDGSTDNTISIIESFNDDRIRIIKTRHNGIANTLNVGVYEAMGRYIIRMDGDDVMMPNRIESQLKYMKRHPECDMCFTNIYGIINGKSIELKGMDKEGEVDYDTVFAYNNLNYLCHPTVIMRKESLLKLPYLYEEYYYAEDLRLWVLAYQYGLQIHMSPERLLKYRIHDDQTCSKNKSQIQSSIYQSKRIYNSLYKKFESDLCVVIAFRNEGDELEKTLSSIRATSYNVDILLIDDCSDDGIDYGFVADMYGAKYYRNNKRLGSAISKNNGIYRCKSKYWMLLDGHMRFYQFGWDIKLLDILSNHQNDLICLENWAMMYDHNEKVLYRQRVLPNNNKCFCGNIRFDEAGQDFTYNWAHTPIDRYGILKRISCIYGAAYAGSVQKYKDIRGMDGIRLYGWEEQLMSIKWWMSGDNVYLYDEITVGHKYRMKTPNPNNNIDFAYNQFLLAWLFYDNDDYNKFCEDMKRYIGEIKVNYVKSALDNNYNKELKDYLYNNVFKHDFGYFLNINSLSMQDHYVTKKYYDLYKKYNRK